MPFGYEAKRWSTQYNRVDFVATGWWRGYLRRCVGGLHRSRRIGDAWAVALYPERIPMYEVRR